MIKQKSDKGEVFVKKRMCDAYMTIEATFIISLSFILMIMLLYIGFFCYEKSVSVQCCYLAALRGSNKWNLSGCNLENYVDKTMKQLVEEKYLVRTEQAYKVQANKSFVTIQTEGLINFPFSFLLGSEAYKWDIYSEKTAERHQPTSYIRRYQAIKE